MFKVALIWYGRQLDESGDWLCVHSFSHLDLGGSYSAVCSKEYLRHPTYWPECSGKLRVNDKDNGANLEVRFLILPFLAGLEVRKVGSTSRIGQQGLDYVVICVD